MALKGRCLVSSIPWRRDKPAPLSTHPLARFSRRIALHQALCRFGTARPRVSPSRREPSAENEHAPKLHAGSPAGDWPDAARLGGPFARHLLRPDLSHRRGADRGDVVLHRRRLSPRRLWRAGQHPLLRAGRRPGGEPLRRLQCLPRRIPAGEFLCLPAARPAHGPLVERDLRLPARARLPGADQCRLFARRIVLFYIATLPD
jgi:hypothetical protein